MTGYVDPVVVERLLRGRKADCPADERPALFAALRDKGWTLSQIAVAVGCGIPKVRTALGGAQ